MPDEYTRQILTVLEAYTRDVRRGVVRVDYGTMDNIHIYNGEIAEIVCGQCRVFAVISPLYPSDENHERIRMDERLRNSLDLVVGDTVAFVFNKVGSIN